MIHLDYKRFFCPDEVWCYGAAPTQGQRHGGNVFRRDLVQAREEEGVATQA